MKKRIFALLLAVLMASSVIACASDASGTTDTTAAPTASTTAPTDTTAAPETELTPDLPDVRFDGTELVIIHNPAVQSYYYEPWIYAENITGDIINDAVYKRNMTIENKYGVKIVSIEDTNPANTAGLASQAQSDEYDLAMCKISHVGTIAPKGMLHNIADLPYVNYDNPWWDSNVVDGLTIDGKLYGMVSDISMMTLSGVRGILFNRDLVKDYVLDDPYDLVKNNKWTLDKMAEMTLAVSADLNGDTAYDNNDRFGMLTEVSNNIKNFVLAAGINLTTVNAEGDIEIAFMNEKTINVIEKCRAFLLDPVKCIDYTTLQSMTSESVYSYGRKLFAADQFLFTQGGAMLFDELNAANMDSEYGIVPNPKFDESQEEYYHCPDINTSMVTIPSANTTEDLERLGILLEELAYQSHKTTYPAYYETIIKLRRAVVPELGEMMDIIKGSINYELSDQFGIDTVTVINQAFNTGSITAAFDAGEKAITLKLKQLSEKLAELP